MIRPLRFRLLDLARDRTRLTRRHGAWRGRQRRPRRAQRFLPERTKRRRAPRPVPSTSRPRTPTATLASRLRLRRGIPTGSAGTLDVGSSSVTRARARRRYRRGTSRCAVILRGRTGSSLGAGLRLPRCALIPTFRTTTAADEGLGRCDKPMSSATLPWSTSGVVRSSLGASPLAVERRASRNSSDE